MPRVNLQGMVYLADVVQLVCFNVHAQSTCYHSAVSSSLEPN